MEKPRIVPQEVRVQEILEQTGAVREAIFNMLQAFTETYT
jgi:hypothetical protein